VMEKTTSTGDCRVVLGASVTLRKEPEGETVCYRIVEEEEADIPTGRLSVSAPLARVLVGRAEGELVTRRKPAASPARHSVLTYGGLRPGT
jgi:transcription elongation factor GreA